MDSFSLGVTEFGVDESCSNARLTSAGPGELLLTVEIQGADGIFAALSGEGQPWEWALYPPQLYVRNVRVAAASWPTETAIPIEEEKSSEIGLYMMEHCVLFNTTIRELPNSQLVIEGRVALSNGSHPLYAQISLTTNVA